jgi:anti-anti-sigma factor
MEPDLTSSEPGRRPHIREHHPAPGRAHLRLLSTNTWAHTLVLTGELNSRSAPALEEEIEGLCQEGVAALRIDLRRLERIDAAGVAVIAFRSQECVRIGCDFIVIAESPALRLALSDAGVALERIEAARPGTAKLVLFEDRSGRPEEWVTETEVPQRRPGRLARWLPGS